MILLKSMDEDGIMQKTSAILITFFWVDWAFIVSSPERSAPASSGC